MIKCIAEIHEWTLANKLKINLSKTKCILIQCKSGAKLKDLQITTTVGNNIIISPTLFQEYGSIAIVLDHSMRSQISRSVTSLCFLLRRISKIRHHTDPQTCGKAINACAASCTDYHNALLTNVPNYLLHKLQLVRNNAARLLAESQRTMHITPVLQDLHWLPIKYRIQYRIIPLIHQAVYSPTTPEYMEGLINFPSHFRISGQQVTHSSLCFSEPGGKLMVHHSTHLDLD